MTGKFAEFPMAVLVDAKNLDKITMVIYNLKINIHLTF